MLKVSSFVALLLRVRFRAATFSSRVFYTCCEVSDRREVTEMHEGILTSSQTAAQIKAPGLSPLVLMANLA